jgi:FKBP-type peptidyl-prolyl cis-trans isomerase (trigger factor)
MAAKKATKTNKITSSVAKTDDGTIQINITLPPEIVEAERKKVIEETVKTTVVPGFRKGKAPLSKVEEQIPEKDMRIQIVNSIAPQAFGQAINDNKIQPAIYPRIEILQAEKGKPWELRATTCEMPEIKLGDYKKDIKGELSAKSIWTPEKGKKDKEEKKELTQMDKEQVVINVLVKTTTIKIPNILIEAEVSESLSQLLDKLDKLGLNLDSYLESIGKTPTELRAEYEQRAKDSLTMTLALNKIVEEEDIQVTDEEVEGALNIATTDPGAALGGSDDEKKRVIASILRRRKALDSLTKLN